MEDEGLRKEASVIREDRGLRENPSAIGEDGGLREGPSGRTVNSDWSHQ